MNFNDKIATYIRKTSRLNQLKKNKAGEFSQTIKEDIKDMLNKGTISRSEVEEYLLSLREVLDEKETEIDNFVENEKLILKQSLLEEFSRELDRHTSNGTDYNLTNEVMEDSINYVEQLLAGASAVPSDTDPIAERLLKVMPSNTYILDTSSQVSEPNIESSSVLKETVTNDSSVIDVEPKAEVDVKSQDSSVDERSTVEEKVVDSVVKTTSSEVTDKPVEKSPSEPVSTVELEKMLAEFEDLLD